MSKEILVEVGKYRVASNPTILKSIGIGSCLSIILYEPDKRIGGMIHAMLPYYGEGRDKHNPIKYVDTSIYILLDDLLRMGAKKEKIIAKIAGGSQMFSFLGSDIMNVGERNIKAAKETLKKEKIRLKSEETGGNCGRTVILDMVTGGLTIRKVSENIEQNI
ncbi:MAG: chemotaxis protein CheD [Thermoplasmata archaeon]|nr:chemotaxis protein CheD [Thermoplasmata archaeon]